MIWVTSNRYVNLGVNSAEEGFNLMWRIWVTLDQFSRHDFPCRIKSVTLPQNGVGIPLNSGMSHLMPSTDRNVVVTG
jgi:hypothetical protein